MLEVGYLDTNRVSERAKTAVGSDLRRCEPHQSSSLATERRARFTKPPPICFDPLIMYLEDLFANWCSFIVNFLRNKTLLDDSPCAYLFLYHRIFSLYNTEVRLPLA